MIAERTKNASRNILWGTLYRIISLVFPFATRTAMIYTMGISYVGLGSLFTSILSILSFAELGVGGAIAYSMYEPIAQNDDDKVCALLNFYRSAYRIIGMIILGIGLLLIPFLNKLVAGDVPEGINLQVLFSVYLLNNVLGYFLFAYRQSLFRASQRVDVVSKIGMVLLFFLNVAQILVLICFHNYYVFVSVIPLVTVLNNVIVSVVSNKVYPQYTCRGKIGVDERKAIWKKINGMLFQKIGGIILTAADTMVISAFLGLKILGIYNGYFMIFTALNGFLSVIQSSIIPSIGNSVVKDSVEKNLADFKKFHFLYMWIVMWWCGCIFCLSQPFIRLWQGAGNMFSDTIVVLLTAYFFSYKMGDCCWIYREAMGLWWEARFIPLTSSIVNLGLNILLVKLIGLPGVLISTIVSLTMINLPWSSKVLFSIYFKSSREYYRYLFRTLKYFIFMCISTAAAWCLCSLISGYGFIALLIKALICMVIPNIILFLFSCRSAEFKPALQFALRMAPDKVLPARLKGLRA